MTADLDQSGNSWHKVRTWLGPSLGWVDTQVKPSRRINIAGSYQVFPGDGVIFVANIGGSVLLALPDVRLWIAEPAYQPATAFERVLIVKDLSGNAGASPIVITPATGQLIDLTSGSFTMNTSHGVARLYPLIDQNQNGWWVG